MAEGLPDTIAHRTARLQAPTAERIEAALAALRRALQPDAAHPPVRASTLTLLVLVSGATAAAAAREVVAHLAAVHPSRTIVITAATTMAPPASTERAGWLAPTQTGASGHGDLLARVETAAVPDGGAGRVLHEVITLEMRSAAALQPVAGLVPALILGELPAYTWAANGHGLDALCAGQLSWLVEASDGLLVESSPLPASLEPLRQSPHTQRAESRAGNTLQPAPLEPLRQSPPPAVGEVAEGSPPLAAMETGVARLRRLLALVRRLEGKTTIADLTWIRLEPWREAMAQCFDPPACRRWASMVDEVELLFEPGRGAADPPAGVLLLGGWLHARLPSHPPIRFRTAPHAGRAAAGVAGAQLRAGGPGGQARFAVELQPDRASVAVRIVLPGAPEVSRRLRLPRRSRAELLGALLQRPGTDPLYQEALEASLRLGRELQPPAAPE